MYVYLSVGLNIVTKNNYFFQFQWGNTAFKQWWAKLQLLRYKVTFVVTSNMSVAEPLHLKYGTGSGLQVTRYICTWLLFY